MYDLYMFIRRILFIVFVLFIFGQLIIFLEHRGIGQEWIVVIVFVIIFVWRRLNGGRRI